MPGTIARSIHIYSRCSRAHLRSATRRYASDAAASQAGRHNDDATELKQAGAMSRRLQQMSDEALNTSDPSVHKSIESAGFSEELRQRLEDKIANATFRSENAAAFAQAGLPSSVDRQTKDIAAAQPWTGTESIHDASLRMLTDAHKQIQTTPRTASIRGPPTKIDTGRPAQKVNAGSRLANARDRSSIYSITNDTGLSREEKEKYRKEMKERFQPGARDLPATIQGLASLANKRIEDAIARGQFKNLPRGQKIERDYNANSPFINTTEYFMNKMIKKQDIVPPWIEKQQEVVSTAARFRSRLRTDWKRHVARVIASRGGSLLSQLELADEYAIAESIANPSKHKAEDTTGKDIEGGRTQRSTTDQHDAESNVIIGSGVVASMPTSSESFLAPSDKIQIDADNSGLVSGKSPALQAVRIKPATVPPFRDPQWEATERSYHVAAIDNLNSLTRSYNLMAPNLAKKPYYNLDRELKTCFADVAPQVASLIRERALSPRIKGVEVIGHKAGGVLEKFAMDRAGHVFDERRPKYGFKEFWRDLWATKS